MLSTRVKRVRKTISCKTYLRQRNTLRMLRQKLVQNEKTIKRYKKKCEDAIQASNNEPIDGKMLNRLKEIASANARGEAKAVFLYDQVSLNNN